MSALVIAITRDAPGGVIAWIEEGTSDPQASIPWSLDFSALPILDGPNAQTYAGVLRDAFLKVQPFQSPIGMILSPPTGIQPDVKFWLKHPACEAYSWESIVNGQDQHIALNSLALLARQAKRGGDPLEIGLFQPPLKILAVLSAIRVSAEGEWLALQASLGPYLSKGLVTLEVLVCQPDLRHSITQGAEKGVIVDVMPDTVTRLSDRIAEAQPHILHFFCHGSLASGQQKLEMVSVSEWLSGQATGALSVSVQSLCALPAVKKTWLVMLNCCLGGSPQLDANMFQNSMAKQFVQAGAASAVGMTSPIDASDAHCVASAFYTRALRDLEPLLKQGVPTLDLNFTAAVGVARDELFRRVSATSSTPAVAWTYPVLYEGLTPLRVRNLDPPLQPAPVEPPPPAAALKGLLPWFTSLWRARIGPDETNRGPAVPAGAVPAGAAPAQPAPATIYPGELLSAFQTRLHMVSTFLRALPADAPLEMRERAREILGQDPAVPQTLWPDLQGRFEITVGDQVEILNV